MNVLQPVCDEQQFRRLDWQLPHHVRTAYAHQSGHSKPAPLYIQCIGKVMSSLKIKTRIYI